MACLGNKHRSFCFFEIATTSLLAQMVKCLAYNVGDLGSIPELGRSSGEGNSYLFQYSGLENSMDCIVHGVNKESDTIE